MSSLRGGGQYRDLAPSEDLSEFASAIATMTKEAQKDDSEEFQKNVIAQFLSTTFDYACNTRGKVDLAIYDDEIPKVLFEVKATGNKAEFIKTPDSSLRGVANAEAIQNKNVDCHESLRDSRNDRWGLESKAFYESILYYLRESRTNNNIKHIILCTAHEFYVINAKAYHKLFANNADKATQKRIDTAYNNCDKKQGTDTSTNKFYDEIARILPDIDATLEFCYVNVASILENPRDLALFYALLSPSILLQIPRYIDANTLNERFYKELLYILGLVQVEQNGKALILPSTTQNTLLHSIKRDFADKLPRDLNKSSDSNALDSRQNALDSRDLAQSHKGESHKTQSQNPNHPHKNSQNSADIFDSHIFPLIMLWNNRILFLRLLESMLLSFRHIDKPFLDISILRDFGALNTLFFKVLAVKNRADIPPNLANIPYLNSSLFEKSALESQGFEIATLQSKPLKIAPDSILRRDKTLREKYIGKDDSLPLLEYLFAFLHAYDFTTTPSDVQNYAKTNHDKLINSAVLGLVFEKLNGYKEGSFYTPSFITRYMCQSSIRKIVVEKFNSANPQWQCKTLADIEYEIHREIRQARNTPDSSLRGSGDSHNEASVRSTDPHLQIQSYRHSEGAKRPKNPRIKSEFLDSSLRTSCHAQNDKSGVDCHESANADSRNDAFVGDSHNDSTKEILGKYNKIFLSIRICDPAVGSGHFLVSALNELIAIKSELGLLLDCNGRRLSDIDLVLENDELLIKDSLGNALDYRIPAHEGIEAHKIQKAIFYTKKELIENCLFGVDINPNSVEICKLRLWIELLKYSYYENIASKELQTLPNIDINIKCGNSLISYFDLRQSLSHYPNIAVKIKQYQQAVRDYKEGIFANRTQINATIKELLQSFRNFCFSDKFKKEIKSFHTKCESYSKKYGNFLAKDDENLRLYVAQSFGYFDFDEDKARADFALLKKEYESIFSLESNKPFEWRFEFPEVLDSNGDFMGFDLIIGNPPYIRQEEIKELKPHLQKSFNIYCGTGDIYTYFYERGHSLLKAKGILTLITSNKFCRAGYGANLRTFLLQSAILDFVDLNGVKVFDKATVDTCIVNLSKQKPTKSHALNYANPNAKDLSTISYSQIPQDSLSSEAFIFVDSPTLALKQKIERIGTPLKEWDIEINYGIKTGYNEAFIIDTATKDRILADCDDTIKSPLPCGGGLGVGNLTEKERTAQIIKPILRGRDIKRYSYEWANLWLINTHNGYETTISSSQKQSTISTSSSQRQSPNRPLSSLRGSEATEAIHKIDCHDFANAKSRNDGVVNCHESISADSHNDKVKIPPIDIADYPALKKHLDKFYPQLQKRTDKGTTPYNLRNCAYVEDFEKEKIVYSEIVREPQFYLDSNNFYAEATSFILTGENLKYLIALLNSKFVTYIFKIFYAGGGLGESGYRYKKAFIEKIPVPKINAKNQKIADKIVNLVDKILESKAQGKDSTTPPCHTTSHFCHTERSEVSQKQHRDFSHSTNTQNDKTNKSQYDTTDLESQIDKLVYQLYDLDSSEIKIIKSK